MRQLFFLTMVPIIIQNITHVLQLDAPQFQGNIPLAGNFQVKQFIIANLLQRCHQVTEVDLSPGRGHQVLVAGAVIVMQVKCFQVLACHTNEPGLVLVFSQVQMARIQTDAEICGMAGLAFLGGSYMAEAFRSGLESVADIQTESALSLGMSRMQVMRYVVFPQALSVSVPAFMANVIFLLKETSVFSAISLMDLMFTAKDLIGLYYKTTECLFLLVVFYLMILLPISILGSLLERRLRYAGFGA